MKKLLIVLALGAIVVSVLVFSGYSVKAAIPHLINYQGMLTDNSGTPLTGSYNLTFEIYDDTTAGNLEWSEPQTGVQVQNGLFNVVLGQVNALDLAFDEQYWLEVQVDNDTMPRIRFTSVGYAYRALVADSAAVAGSGGIGGSGCEGYIPKFTSSTTLDNSVISESGYKIDIGTTNPQVKLDVMGMAAGSKSDLA